MKRSPMWSKRALKPRPGCELLMYLVDTNIVSEARRGTRQAVSWLRSVDPSSVFLSALTLGELQGPLFRCVTESSKDVGPDRLNDKAVARLVKSAEAKSSGRPNSPVIRCAPAWPPRPKSMSVMCRSSSAMLAPK